MPAVRGQYGPRGPIIEALVGINEPLQRWMLANRRTVPPPIPVRLLIDTGADTTTIAEIHMRSLGIDPINKAPVRTITTDSSGLTCNVYGASLQLLSAGFGEKPLSLPTMEVLSQEFHNEGIDGLVGRDVLGTLIFTMDGPRRRFSAEWL